MAGRIIAINTGAVSLATSTTKTILTVKPPSNIPCRYVYLAIFAENASGTTSDSTDRQLLWTLGEITVDSGTATAGTAKPIWKSIEGVAGTPQLTWRYNASSEPTYTSGATLDTGAAHPAGGVLKCELIPWGGELCLPSGKEHGLKVTNNCGDTLNIYAVARVEE